MTVEEMLDQTPLRQEKISAFSIVAFGFRAVSTLCPQYNLLAN